MRWGCLEFSLKSPSLYGRHSGDTTVVLYGYDGLSDGIAVMKILRFDWSGRGREEFHAVLSIVTKNSAYLHTELLLSGLLSSVREERV